MPSKLPPSKVRRAKLSAIRQAQRSSSTLFRYLLAVEDPTSFKALFGDRALRKLRTEWDTYRARAVNAVLSLPRTIDGVVPTAAEIRATEWAEKHSSTETI